MGRDVRPTFNLKKTGTLASQPPLWSDAMHATRKKGASVLEILIHPVAWPRFNVVSGIVCKTALSTGGALPCAIRCMVSTILILRSDWFLDSSDRNSGK